MTRVVVIGGGAVGSACALFLRLLGAGEVQVQVVEPDPTLACASSALSAGSIRQQFSNAVNVRMSRYGHEFLSQAQHHLGVDEQPVDLGYVPGSYLFLASAAGAEALRANHAVQRAEGADVALLDTPELTRRHPWLNADGLALASLGLAAEGWFDGQALACALARKARSLGARWERARVVGFTRAGGGRLRAAQLDDGRELAAEVFVNAAGPWARAVAALAGVELPVAARRRTVFVFSCPTRLPPTPLVVDPAGVWFRSEGSGYIGAWTPGPGDADPDDLPLDQPDLAQFEQRLWPALAARVPAFEALRMHRAWAGYYEVNTLDHNALIGPHPQCPELMLANGHSGHGLQHAPATGRGVAELIVHGRTTSLDLSDLSPQRLVGGHALFERAVI